MLKIKDLITLGADEFSVEAFKDLHALISENVNKENIFVSMHSHKRENGSRIYRVSFTYGQKAVGFGIWHKGNLVINTDETLKDSRFIKSLIDHLERI